VPMLTRFGRFSEWIRALMLGAAVVTRALWPTTSTARRSTRVFFPGRRRSNARPGRSSSRWGRC